jgi:hypothetical protein
MTTTITPPPAGTDAPPPGQRPTSGAARVIAILIAVFGAFVIIGAIISALVTTIVSASVDTTTRTADVADVTSLDVDMAAGTLRIEFADVSEAELEVTGTAGAERWTFRTEEGELVVASPQGWFNGGWPFGGWPFGERAADDATLVLPESLKGTDARLSLAAGELIVDEGDFGEVDLDMGAGRTVFSASVDSITADVSAGGAELELEGAREASFSVSAGALQATLSGQQPRTLEIDVSAGSAEVTVPEGDYNIVSDVTAGEFDNRVGSTPDADSTVNVQVSAGKAVLKAD